MTDNTRQKKDISQTQTVFGEYLQRFKEVLWDSYLLTIAVASIDVEKLYKRLENEGTRERVFDSLERMGKLGRETYTIHKLSLTFCWAEVESFMDAFLKEWLTHEVPPATLPIFEKVKLKQNVMEFEKLTRDEVIALYVDGLKDQVRKSSEVKTFFAALEEVGLKECNVEEKLGLKRISPSCNRFAILWCIRVASWISVC